MNKTARPKWVTRLACIAKAWNDKGSTNLTEIVVCSQLAQTLDNWRTMSVVIHHSPESSCPSNEESIRRHMDIVARGEILRPTIDKQKQRR